MSLPRLLAFVAVVLGILGGVHLYFWLRLVRDTGVPSPWRAWLTALLALAAASLPLAMAFGRRLPAAVASLLAWPTFVWLGLVLLLFVLLVGGDLVRLFAAIATRLVERAPIDPERRLIFARTIGVGASAGAGLLGSVAVWRGVARPELRTVEVGLARLPESANGTTIALLTDVHVGPTIGRAFIEDVVRRTNEVGADVIAITGDLVDGSVAALRDAVAPLAELRARHGVFFVTGNHEYFSGADEWIAELSRLGIRVLRNERVAIGDFDLAGVDDHNAARFAPGHGEDVARALAGRDPAREVVLLAHQPRTVKEAARHGVGLQLSGHTHGGQIWPFNFAVKLQQPYVAGLARHGDTQLYVSCGTGYWGPPMRLGTRSEITKVVLRRA
jgi:uncharacterized protein